MLKYTYYLMCAIPLGIQKECSGFFTHTRASTLLPHKVSSFYTVNLVLPIIDFARAKLLLLLLLLLLLILCTCRLFGVYYFLLTSSILPHITPFVNTLFLNFNKTFIIGL